MSEYIIKSKSSLFKFNLKEIWQYRDLIKIFVKRDIVSANKQTLLGPLWFLLAPLFTVFIYVFVFNNIAGISTDGVPAILFYLAGTTLWNYFQSCFLATSSTFLSNASLFGKVYFPRMVSPISIVISSLLKFFIQFFLFLIVWSYYVWTGAVSPNATVLFLPLYVLLLAGISLGIGVIISSLTTKYRDLSYFISFGVTLWMYVTPVIYPVSAIPEQFKFLISYNPISPVIEAFRYSFTGNGSFVLSDLLYSFAVMIIVLFIGLLLFNKTEKTFMDTV